MRAPDLNPSIREFGDLDTASIYALVSDVYTSSDIMSETLDEKFPTLDSFERYINDLSSRPGAMALAAVIGEDILGYLTIMPRRQAKLHHTSELNMGVHSSARGRGIGKLLLKEALRRARESGILEIIYLMVRDDNTFAIRLYENMGFDRVAILKNDTKTPDGYYDGYLMRKFV